MGQSNKSLVTLHHGYLNHAVEDFTVTPKIKKKKKIGERSWIARQESRLKRLFIDKISLVRRIHSIPLKCLLSWRHHQSAVEISEESNAKQVLNSHSSCSNSESPGTNISGCYFTVFSTTKANQSRSFLPSFPFTTLATADTRSDEMQGRWRACLLYVTWRRALIVTNLGNGKRAAPLCGALVNIQAVRVVSITRITGNRTNIL